MGGGGGEGEGEGEGEGVCFRTGKPRKTCTKKRPRITSVWAAIFPELIYVSRSDISTEILFQFLTGLLKQLNIFCLLHKVSLQGLRNEVQSTWSHHMGRI
jgi:hypothetical protein